MYELTNVGSESETLDSLVHHPRSNGVDFSFPAAVHRLCDRFLPTTPQSRQLAAATPPSRRHTPSFTSSAAARVAAASKRQKRAAFKQILDHRLTVPTQCLAMQTFIKGAFANSFVRSCDVVIDPPAPYQMSTGVGGKGLAGTVSGAGAGDKAERLASLFDELDRRYALLDEKRDHDGVDGEQGEGKENDNVEEADKENAETDTTRKRLSTSTVVKTLHLLALLRRRDEDIGVGRGAGRGRGGVEVVPYQIEFSASSRSPFHRHFNVDIWLHERDLGRRWPSTTIHFG